MTKEGRHFEGDDQKRVISFVEEKYRVTPSVTAPSDTNVSDATARLTYVLVF